MRLPNFFIVGAPKTGTTSLYHHLDQHPDVFMSPVKETSYFSLEIREERLAPELRAAGRRNAAELKAYFESPHLEKRFGGIVTEWGDYRRLFAGASGQMAIGEASPCYLWSETAPAGIAACVPAAKIVILLRNPADRAFSQYLQRSNSGSYSGTFRDFLDSAMRYMRFTELCNFHPFLELGMYANQVERYMSLFPASQIGVWLYEDTRSPGFLRSVFDFLGVDNGFEPDTTTRYLEQQVPRVRSMSSILKHGGPAQGLKKLVPPSLRPLVRKFAYRPRGSVKMEAADRSMLVEYYRSNILKLEKVIERDLSAWLK